MGSKQVPNRIINAEGIRKALDRHLGGYHSALGAILAALGRVLRAIRSPKEGPTHSNLATPLETRQRGGVGEGINPSPQGLEEKRDWLRGRITPNLYTP